MVSLGGPAVSSKLHDSDFGVHLCYFNDGDMRVAWLAFAGRAWLSCS